MFTSPSPDPTTTYPVAFQTLQHTNRRCGIHTHAHPVDHLCLCIPNGYTSEELARKAASGVVPTVNHVDVSGGNTSTCRDNHFCMGRGTLRSGGTIGIAAVMDTRGNAGKSHLSFAYQGPRGRFYTVDDPADCASLHVGLLHSSRLRYGAIDAGGDNHQALINTYVLIKTLCIFYWGHEQS